MIHNLTRQLLVILALIIFMPKAAADDIAAVYVESTGTTYVTTNFDIGSMARNTHLSMQFAYKGDGPLESQRIALGNVSCHFHRELIVTADGARLNLLKLAPDFKFYPRPRTACLSATVGVLITREEFETIKTANVVSINLDGDEFIVPEEGMRKIKALGHRLNNSLPGKVGFAEKFPGELGLADKWNSWLALMRSNGL